MNEILALAIEQAPGLIRGFKSLFAQRNPGAPEPTDAEVIAAFNSAFQSSLDKDDAWFAAHPE